MTNNIYTPFTYLIGWKELNRWYYGVRFARGCHPDDLWTKYFTSSKYVQKMRGEYGEPNVVEIRQTFDDSLQAREWEEKVIRRIRAVNSLKWLNKQNGGTKFSIDSHSIETKIKIGERKKGKPSWNIGVSPSQETRIKMSDSNRGKVRSEETRLSISNAMRGKLKSKEHRSKMSAMRKGKPGKPLTEEHKAKIRSAKIGKPRSVKTRTAKPEILDEPI